MKISLHTSSFGAITLDDAICKTRELGYNHVELAADISNTLHFVAHQAGAKEQIHFAKQLRKHKLELSAIDIGGWDLPLCISNAREEYRVRAVQNVQNVIHVAGNLGCHFISSHLWGLNGKQEIYDKQECLESFKKSISELSPIVKPKPS